MVWNSALNSRDLFENLHLAFFVIVEKLEKDFTMMEKSPAKESWICKFIFML